MLGFLKKKTLQSVLPLFSLIGSSSLSAFCPALQSHRMYFLFKFVLFWTGLKQPVHFHVVWLLFKKKKEKKSVWIEAQLHPASLLPPLLLIKTILQPVWMMLIGAHFHFNSGFGISLPFAVCLSGELWFECGPQCSPAAASSPLQLPGRRWPNQPRHDTGHTGHESPAGRRRATAPVRTWGKQSTTLYFLSK